MRSIYLFLLSLTGSFAITYLVSAYQNVSASFLGIFSIIILAGLYYLYNIVLVRKTHWKRCLMLSVLLSFSTVGGIYLDANTLLENSSILQTGKLAILCIFLTPLTIRSASTSPYGLSLPTVCRISCPLCFHIRRRQSISYDGTSVPRTILLSARV